MSIENRLTMSPFPPLLMNTDFCAFETPYPPVDSTKQSLVHLLGRPALSLRLASISLPRCHFAPTIPPGRTLSHVQRSFQG